MQMRLAYHHFPSYCLSTIHSSFVTGWRPDLQLTSLNLQRNQPINLHLQLDGKWCKSYSKGKMLCAHQLRIQMSSAVTSTTMVQRASHPLTISVLVAHVDVVVLEAGALLGILVALDLGDQRRLARLFVADDQEALGRR